MAGRTTIWARRYFARGRQLEAAREFRKASDETPNDPIAPEALLRVGDVYADLWRRPELDPTYGQTALSTYQELLNRYPGAARQSGDNCGSRSSTSGLPQEFKAGMYYFRPEGLRLRHPVSQGLVATYPKSAVAFQRLWSSWFGRIGALGYREDVQETCEYIRDSILKRRESARSVPPHTGT